MYCLSNYGDDNKREAMSYLTVVILICVVMRYTEANQIPNVNVNGTKDVTHVLSEE